MTPARIVPFPGGPGERPEERGLVEVHRCDQAEALVARGLLESEGIPVLLRSRLLASVHPFSVGDQGEVVLLVPGPEAGRSRLLLSRIAAGPPFPSRPSPGRDAPRPARSR